MRRMLAGILAMMASPAMAEVGMYAGADALHGRTPAAMVEVDHGIGEAVIGVLGEPDLRWRNHEETVFAGYTLTWQRYRWETSFGLVAMSRETRIVGTRWAFDLGVTYRINEHWRASLTHLSNAEGAHRILFGEGHCGCSNRGWNVLAVGYAW